jgi:hypothetical protein
MDRPNGRIGKGLRVKPRGVLGVAIIPKANRVLSWLGHIISPSCFSNEPESEKQEGHGPLDCGFKSSANIYS